jgi:hypothetical protein
VPLVRIASDSKLMHVVPTWRATIGVAWLVIGIVTAFEPDFDLAHGGGNAESRAITRRV